MSLRLKLLLLGLATLVLPWGGCQYAREMESALREGEENSLQAVSQTIAASLQGRTDLLYRESLPLADARARYPKIAVVSEADLPIIAQRSPGETIRFELITIEQSQRALRRRASDLNTINQLAIRSSR